MLVDYIADVTAAFAVAKIEPLVNFDPLDPALLRDPKFAGLTTTERVAKCTEVHQARLVRALKHIRETVRPAVGRSFYRKDWITLDQYKEAVPRTTRDSQPTRESEDATMDDILDTFCAPSATPTATSNNPLDDGESTPSQ
ncbi:hypothetical protein G6F56_008431 [Rhizopus delemar]|nr:hypothetical protein G6F56_008431 [Rhizopus delemar]